MELVDNVKQDKPKEGSKDRIYSGKLGENGKNALAKCLLIDLIIEK